MKKSQILTLIFCGMLFLPQVLFAHDREFQVKRSNGSIQSITFNQILVLSIIKLNKLSQEIAVLSKESIELKQKILFNHAEPSHQNYTWEDALHEVNQKLSHLIRNQQIVQNGLMMLVQDIPPTSEYTDLISEPYVLKSDYQPIINKNLSNKKTPGTAEGTTANQPTTEE